ncbi:hypothetical protein GWI33_019229 [Rhynchophorus ferrugineus]|uniref:non-specific serine/threonine protein kinase n=1 Tax=Rhynchophorus ferrugineus TaxID=354439 RepID=A0A834HS53_RHYFE|nr:hypothetical protein GWI33_019229 [Rhynchophorus ferrugineus]
MPPKKKKENGYKFASPLPKGLILEDIAKKKWKLGVSIGKGGFGEIYSAQEAEAKGNNYPFVVKIEPHENGPLFVEINFYIRNAKVADVEKFKKENSLNTFGMPVYYGSGSHEYNGERYRFLIMEKFGSDLLMLFNQNNKQFPVQTVFKIGLQIIDVLKYIHNRGYVHADIKGANLLLGLSKDDQNKQIYLVDFGLATKYSLEKEFKPNPKKAHDGTIEYLSRDAHLGVQTRRGDLEILAYNMLHWLGCKLPWENKIKDPKLVQKSKEDSMSSVSNMIKVCFDSTPCPKAIEDYLIYLSTLKFNTAPDYEKIKTIFKSGLKSAGGTLHSSLEFSMSKTPSKTPRTPGSAGRSSNRNKGKKNEMDDEATTPKSINVTRPKKGFIKPIKYTDDDTSEHEVSKPKLTKAKVQSRKVNRDNSSEVDSDIIESSPVVSVQSRKRKVQQKTKPLKIQGINGMSNIDSPNRKPRGKPKNNIGQRKQNLSSISEQDTDDDDNETPTKRIRKRKLRTKNASNTNNSTEQTEAYSDNEQVTENRKKKTNSSKLKKGQAMSLDDLTVGYTDAMKEVLFKKMKKENKKGKLN